MLLEIKEKHDMNTDKTRRVINSDLLQKLADKDMMGFLGSSATKESPFLKRFAHIYWTKGYGPHLVVRYQRRAYTDNFFSSIRLTFDSNIETCKWNNFKYNNPIMIPVAKDM